MPRVDFVLSDSEAEGFLDYGSDGVDGSEIQSMQPIDLNNLDGNVLAEDAGEFLNASLQHKRPDLDELDYLRASGLLSEDDWQVWCVEMIRNARDSDLYGVAGP